MKRRVLLTGASGFIGRQAIGPLRERGFEVVAMGRRAVDVDGVEHVAADLLDGGSLEKALRRIGASHLLHLAWDVTPGEFWAGRANLDWAAASLRLYRGFVAAGGRHVAVAGTCAEYDWSAPRLDEDAALRPATLYGVAKDGLHRLLRAASRLDGVSLGWGRVFLLYGPGEAPERLVSGVTRRLLAGETAPVGNGDLRRDFMHVGDVAGALATTLDREYDGAVNIGSGEGVSLREVVMTIAERVGRPDLVRFGARPAAGEPAALVAVVDRLRGLGFAPRFTLARGLAETVDWWAHSNSLSG